MSGTMDLPLCLMMDSTHIINARREMSVGNLMGLVAEKLALQSVEELYLRTGTNNLSDNEMTLADYGLGTPYTQIFLSQRLLGGKVHGSLARAGKVRGQTPKVEKQEKKKKKTGRAKRRQQYNRRFVNVVATFGRRRGPNSNADAGGAKSSNL
ncbi:hypothetical protein RvY_09491 [Ramazzottius varieornatus]|uniref:Uncharacterized protein n=1 Tax=Ramazzottius varieornatus TaxID=947166 RepID=A0A1D1VBQ7_RAMVA|nr:hypothetical protein RvY_09491 [Ramazzottius varieornatus]